MIGPGSDKMALLCVVGDIECPDGQNRNIDDYNMQNDFWLESSVKSMG